MTDETNSLADALAYQIKRNQQLLANYAEFRNMPGVYVGFAEAMIKADLDAAIDAVSNQDIEAMIRSYEALKGNE